MTKQADQKTNNRRSSGASFVFTCLVLSLVLSVLATVSVSHEGRSQVGVLKRLQQTNAAYLAQASRLQLELSTLAEYGRVESLAVERLGMRRVTADEMVVSP